MTPKARLESYLARMKAFNEWEATQSPEERPPEAIVADLGFLVSFVSVEDRVRDSDPEKLGIQRMRALLARMSRK